MTIQLEWLASPDLIAERITALLADGQILRTGEGEERHLRKELFQRPVPAVREKVFGTAEKFLYSEHVQKPLKYPLYLFEETPRTRRLGDVLEGMDSEDSISALMNKGEQEHQAYMYVRKLSKGQLEENHLECEELTLTFKTPVLLKPDEKGKQRFLPACRIKAEARKFSQSQSENPHHLRVTYHRRVLGYLPLVKCWIRDDELRNFLPENMFYRNPNLYPRPLGS
jgi:hypothetical protein